MMAWVAFLAVGLTCWPPRVAGEPFRWSWDDGPPRVGERVDVIMGNKQICATFGLVDTAPVMFRRARRARFCADDATTCVDAELLAFPSRWAQ